MPEAYHLGFVLRNSADARGFSSLSGSKRKLFQKGSYQVYPSLSSLSCRAIVFKDANCGGRVLSSEALVRSGRMLCRGVNLNVSSSEIEQKTSPSLPAARAFWKKTFQKHLTNLSQQLDFFHVLLFKNTVRQDVLSNKPCRVFPEMRTAGNGNCCKPLRTAVPMSRGDRSKEILRNEKVVDVAVFKGRD